MKILGLIIAGAIAAIAQTAVASVIVLPADTDPLLLQGWGKAQEITARKHPTTSGPVQFGDGVTYRSTSHSSVIGYTGTYNFGSKPSWNDADAPMAGLNVAQGSMTFTFAAPVSQVIAEMNWAAGFSNGAPIFMSIFDSSNNLLDTFQFSDGHTDLLATGYYGFSRANADISRLVLSNGFIGARNFYTIAGQGGGFGGGGGGFGHESPHGESFQAAVPEPGTWALMILGFGATGAMLRRGRKTSQATALV